MKLLRFFCIHVGELCCSRPLTLYLIYMWKLNINPCFMASISTAGTNETSQTGLYLYTYTSTIVELHCYLCSRLHKKEEKVKSCTHSLSTVFNTLFMFGIFGDTLKPTTQFFVAAALHHEEKLGHVKLIITHISLLASMTCLT